MTNDQRPLAGKVILISGAARGLGRVLALALARAGAVLALHDLAPTHLEETYRQVQALPRQPGCMLLTVARDYPHDCLSQRSWRIGGVGWAS